MKPEPSAKRKKFSLARKDTAMEELVRDTDKKMLAAWAIDCAERVLPFFEEKFPGDRRPRDALAALRAWIATGIFHMADIRAASLASHAAAREVGKDTAARSAARAAGQAVTTAHVPTHSLGAAIYTRQAVWRAAQPDEPTIAIARERDWQYKHLLALREITPPEK